MNFWEYDLTPGPSPCKGEGEMRKQMPILHNIEKLKERRRELRQRSTPEEKLLWKNLRDNKLGVKFKRQHSVGGYILDFFCSSERLIIEIDGEIHNTNENKEYDAVRDDYFKELGYVTLRFSNEDIKNNLEEVLSKIKKQIAIKSI